mgnify:FL=1
MQRKPWQHFIFGGRTKKQKQQMTVADHQYVHDVEATSVPASFDEYDEEKMEHRIRTKGTVYSDNIS